MTDPVRKAAAKAAVTASRKTGRPVDPRVEALLNQADQVAACAATPCATCRHLSAHHSDIGTCEACSCMTFEEDW